MQKNPTHSEPASCLVYQTYMGELTDTVLQSQHSMQSYAQRMGAHYQFEPVLKLGSEPSPLFLKYRAVAALEHYESVLYVDTDVIAQSHAPCVFSAHDSVPGSVGAWFQLAELGYSTSGSPLNSGVILYRRHRGGFDLLRNTPLHSQRFQREFNPQLARYYASVWWRDWHLKFRDSYLACSDGKTVNDEPLFLRVLQTYQIPCFGIHSQWNYRMNNTHSDSAVADQYFLHFVGKSKRLMRLFA